MDVRVPIYLKGDDQALFDHTGLDDDERIGLDSVFRNAADDWDKEGGDEAVLDVFLQFCNLLPRTSLLPANFSDADNNAEWHWAKVRCVLGGAGYAHHKALADHLEESYPGCPLHPDEDRETWWDRLRSAHTMCGWPATLAWAKWSSVVNCLHFRDRDCDVAAWCHTVALFHLLKHVRVRRKSGQTIVMFDHAATGLDWPNGTNVPGGDLSTRVKLAAALRCPVARAKGMINPIAKALNSWLSVLVVMDYLQQLPVVEVSPLVLTGTWSSLMPSPKDTGFFQHGLRLDGVWQANMDTRKIDRERGDDATILGYAWNLSPNSDLASEREQFRASLPDTWPRDVSPWQWVRKCFPNIDDRIKDDAAYQCLFDAIICCAMMKNEPDAVELKAETPILVVFPSDATPQASTNTGKTRLSHRVLANCFRPGITLSCPSGGSSTSAPDERALASLIRNEGTLSLDEFWPMSDSGILGNRALQSMTVDGVPNVGQCYENEPEKIRLKFPICANMKTNRFKHDVANRTLPVWLRMFTPEEMGNADNLSLVESGKLSTLLRLSAVELVIRNELFIAAARKVGGSPYWRWHQHLEVARVLADLRGVKRDRLELELTSLREEMVKHSDEAEQSGLIAQCDSGIQTTVNLLQVFQGTSIQDTEMTLTNANAEAERCGDRHGFSAQHLLKGRAQAMGVEGPLHRLMEHWTSKPVRCSNMAMGLRLAEDMRRRMPTPGSWWHIQCGSLPSHWYIVRGSDNNKSPRFKAVYGPRDGYPAGAVTDSATFPPPGAKI
jgi:hypothetical protein